MIYTNANITQPPFTYQFCHTAKFLSTTPPDTIESNQRRTVGCNVVELHLPLTRQWLQRIYENFFERMSTSSLLMMEAY
jgi:hypothetical protein